MMVPHTQPPPPAVLAAMKLDGMDESAKHSALEKTPAPTTTRKMSQRPEFNMRSSTDPTSTFTPSVLLQNLSKDWAMSAPKTRNRSPFARSHLRSRSSGAVAMTRAHSLPSPQMSRGFDTPASSSGSMSAVTAPTPMRTPARTRSPFHPEEAYGQPPRRPAYFDPSAPTVGGAGSAIESISEDAELSIAPRSQQLPLHTVRVSSSSRRRPASPLHSLANATPTSYPTTLTDQTTIPNYPTNSGSNSPSLAPQKYINELHPSLQQPPQLHHYSSISSISTATSTPSSARSRSPSISSLDTIEDEPEMESEAEAIERLKRAAEGEEGEERRRSSLDGGGRGFGFTRGRSERKRWSVCGAERRGDLDLETIWED